MCYAAAEKLCILAEMSTNIVKTHLRVFFLFVCFLFDQEGEETKWMKTNLKQASSEFLQLLPQLVPDFRKSLTLLVF